MWVFCSVFIEDKLKNLTLILCLQIIGDSNVILLKISWVSGQNLGEGGIAEKGLYFAEYFLLLPVWEKNSDRKFQMIYSTAMLHSRHVNSLNKKNSLFHYQIQTVELLDIIFGFLIIFNQFFLKSYWVKLL